MSFLKQIYTRFKDFFITSSGVPSAPIVAAYISCNGKWREIELKQKELTNDSQIS